MQDSDLFASWRAGFWAAELRFPCCMACGRWSWYPLPRCGGCGSNAFDWRQVSPRGTLYSWTRVHRAFGRQQDAPVPYIVGLVDIDEAKGVRLVCLGSSSVIDPAIGVTVHLLPNGTADEPCWVFDVDPQNKLA